MCKVSGCTICKKNRPHYCRVCKNIDVDHFSANCPAIKSAAILLVSGTDNKILLVHGSKCKSWMMPGGIVDRGETPKEAAYREFKEETTIDLDESKVKSSTLFYRQHSSSNFTQIHILKISRSLNISKFIETNETDNIMLIPLDRLKHIIYGGTREIILRRDNFNTFKDIFDNGIL